MLNKSIDLQMFADGGAGASGSATGGAAPSGDTGNGAPRQQEQTADTQPATAQTDAPDTGGDFESLIKGRYKEEYNARVSDTIKTRLKGSHAVLDAIAGKYGIDASDTDAMLKAINGEQPEQTAQEEPAASADPPAQEDDNSQYEAEALERGLPVETVAKIHKLEAREAQRKEEARQAELQKHFNGLQQQAEQLKQLYPNFDLQKELQNPQFTKLTAPGMGVDVRTAYEVVHRDELRGQEMRYATQRTANRISAAVQANARRPVENGIKGSVGMTSTTNPANMSKAQRDQYIERAARGERILFKEM